MKTKNEEKKCNKKQKMRVVESIGEAEDSVR